MIDDENKPKGITAYAQRLKDLPAADGAAYPQRTGLSAVATEPRLGFQSRASRPTGLAVAATPQLGAPKPQGIAAPAAMPTSDPGISKVTGIAGASPLYTNMGSDQNQADSKPEPQGIAAGFDPAKAAQYSSPPAGPGIGFSPNEGIARMAAANSTRQSMIDAQPRGGFSVIGGLDAMGRTRQEQENDAKSARWRQDALISEAKYRPQMAGIAGEAIRGDSQQAVEGMRQQGIAAGINTQRRGQDLGFAAQMRQQGIAERGQDLQSATAREQISGHERVAEIQANAAKRLTLPQSRENQEIEAARQRLAGMDPAEIKRRTANYTETGRENPDFDPTLARVQTLAGRRMYGDDRDFDARQQQQPAKSDDAPSRFKADKAMAGHKLGKQTERGTEVFDANGRLIGFYR